MAATVYFLFGVGIKIAIVALLVAIAVVWSIQAAWIIREERRQKRAFLLAMKNVAEYPGNIYYEAACKAQKVQNVPGEDDGGCN